jgi:hypothetical protein
MLDLYHFAIIVNQNGRFPAASWQQHEAHPTARSGVPRSIPFVEKSPDYFNMISLYVYVSINVIGLTHVPAATPQTAPAQQLEPE